MNDLRMMDTTKLCYHKDRVERVFRGERVAPIHIDIGITKFCNIKCVYCYGFFQNVKHVFIQREPLLQTLRDAKEIGVKSVALIGDGEPTCNPYLYDAMLQNVNLRLDMALSTNGFLINNERKCYYILNACKWMRFCMSAGTREEYKKIHGKDCFNAVVNNVKRMVEIRNKFNFDCEIGLQAVYVPGMMNKAMIEEAKLAVSLGVNYFVIKQCSLPDEGQSGMSWFDVNEYDSPRTIEVLKTCEDFSTPDTEIRVKWNTIKQKGQRPYNGCPSIPLISEMSGNGDWYPCGYMFGEKEQFLKYRFGNVHEKRLKEIFESEHYWNIIKMMRADFDVHAQCKGACRQDNANKFCYDYLHGRITFPEKIPENIKGVNFV